ncbi:MAG: hypothetical protein GWO24_29895 [Akkermansiaceae bacterium]|nr:hypothetical protein [Akkermansiaceae bacterium]
MERSTHPLLGRGTLLLLVSGIVLLSLFAAGAGRGSDGAENVTVDEVTTDEDGAVRITFSPLLETFYHCPGARA